MKFVYRLKNLENGYTWGAYETADKAFDVIASDPDYSRHGNVIVIREQIG